jgi:hypothetical protein
MIDIMLSKLETGDEKILHGLYSKELMKLLAMMDKDENIRGQNKEFNYEQMLFVPSLLSTKDL